jgi:hypothetical protein
MYLAAHIKRLVHKVNTGTMASVFPEDSENAGERTNLNLRSNADVGPQDDLSH